LTLRVIVEQIPLGTAGCLRAITPDWGDTLIVYGDILFDIALAPLFEFHSLRRALLTIVAHPNDHPRTSDLIVEDGGLVRAILPVGRPRKHDYRNLVPAGLYLASPAFFAKIKPDAKLDMIRDLLPEIIASGSEIAVYNTPEYLRDVGTQRRHELAERDLAAGRVEAMNGSHSRPAILFDCDGVLNEEPGLHGAVNPDEYKDHTRCRECHSTCT